MTHLPSNQKHLPHNYHAVGIGSAAVGTDDSFPVGILDFLFLASKLPQMVSDEAAQKKAAVAVKRGGKAGVAASTKAAAAENGSSSSADNLANGVGALQISDRTCTGVLCSHPLSRDIYE